jgi:hypothetical protein
MWKTVKHIGMNIISIVNSTANEVVDGDNIPAGDTL